MESVAVKRPLDGQYYCTILRTKNETRELIVYCAILPTDDTIFPGCAIYLKKSFNTVAQSFNRTYKRPICLCNLKYFAEILTVKGPLKDLVLKMSLFTI